MDDFSNIISIINCMRKLLILLIVSWFCIIPTCAKTVDNTVDSMNIQSKKGYVGTLPDVTSKFQPSIPTEATPVFEAQDGFDDPDQLKPVPRDNPAFINIILKQGYNRQIRRMCAALGYHVVSLNRIRFMHLNLDVEPGKYRLLTPSFTLSGTGLISFKASQAGASVHVLNGDSTSPNFLQELQLQFQP